MTTARHLELLKRNQYSIIAGIAIILLFAFTSCSSTSDSTQYINEEGDETFSFNDDEDGNDSRLTAHFDGDRITSISKDGQRISGDEFDKYSERVYQKLNSLRKEMKEFDNDMLHFSIDMDAFNKGMDEFREKMLKEGLSSSVFHFKGKNFKEEMEKLKEELSKLNGEEFDFHFDSEANEKAMKELSESLKNFHLNNEAFDFKFDNEELKEQMEKLKEELKDQDWESIDIPEFHFDMRELKEDMNDLKIEMKKLKSFMKEMRTELVKDNLINNEDEDFDLEFSAESMKINDIEVSPGLHSKYKEIYRKHFGKEIEEEIKIRN